MNFDKEDISPQGLELKIEDMWNVLREYRLLFDRVEERFTDIVKRFAKFNEIDAFFVTVKADIVALNSGIDRCDSSFKQKHAEWVGKTKEFEKTIKSLVETHSNTPLKMIEIQERLNGVQEVLSGLLNSMKHLGSDIKTQSTSMTKRVDDLVQEVNVLKKNTSVNIESLEKKTAEKIAGTESFVKSLVNDAKVTWLKEAQSRTADDVESMSQRLSIVEKTMDGLTRQIAKLDLTIRAMKAGT